MKAANVENLITLKEGENEDNDWSDSFDSQFMHDSFLFSTKSVGRAKIWFLRGMPYDYCIWCGNVL